MAAKRWVGLDVGETLTHICVLGDGDAPLLQCSTGSTSREIADALVGCAIPNIEAILMESGGPLALRCQLERFGYPITMIDARKTQRFLSIRHNKTDENDARGLAEIAKLGEFSRLAVHCRSEESQHLRNALNVRNRLVLVQCSMRASLRSMLRNCGSSIRKISRYSTMGDTVRTELRLLETQGAGNAVAQLLPLLEVCETTLAFVARLDANLKQMALANPITKRFMQIPGVGPVCALSFYATIDDPSRFQRAADVGAYLGMIPRVQQSGASRRYTRITRAGHAMTRGYLFLSAGVMMSRAKTSCAIRDWGIALTTRE